MAETRISNETWGEHECFEELFERYGHLIWRICFSRLKDEQAADDALQETFVSAWRHIETKGWPTTPVQPWLACISVHKCVDELRRRSRRGVSLEALFSSPDAMPPLEQVETDEVVQQRRELSQLALALKTLPTDLRSSLVLYTVESRTHKEIATLTNVSLGTVKSRIHRARIRLRQHSLLCE